MSPQCPSRSCLSMIRRHTWKRKVRRGPSQQVGAASPYLLGLLNGFDGIDPRTMMVANSRARPGPAGEAERHAIEGGNLLALLGEE